MEVDTGVQDYLKFEIDQNDELAVLYFDLYEQTVESVDKFINRTGVDSSIFKRKMMLIAFADLIDIPEMKEQMHLEAEEALLYLADNLKLNLNGLEVSHLSKVIFLIEGTLIDAQEIARNSLEAKKKHETYKSMFKNLIMANVLFGNVTGTVNERDFFEKSGAFIHKKGAKARSKKFNEKKREAFRRFNEGSYSSFASCADDIHKHLGVSSDTVKRWLSEMQKQHRQSPLKPQ